MSGEELHGAVRAWAKGLHPLEAGVELLIRHGRTIYEGAPWLTEFTGRTPRLVAVDAEVLLAQSGHLSGGERRVVRIAVSLLGGQPVDLSENIPGLDAPTLALVLDAIAHANGST